MRRNAFVLLLALSSPVLLAGTRSAWAQTKVDPEVQKHFGAANDLYNEGRYADALVEYDAAYELSHNYKILYNRGQCLVMLKREPEAIDSFERYLKDGGSDVPADRRKQVEIDIEKLKLRLGSILIEGAPTNAEIYLDGRYYGNAPMKKPIPAGAGTHDLLVKPVGGGTPYTAKLKVVAGAMTTERMTDTVLPAVVTPPVTGPANVPMTVTPGYDVPPPAPPPPSLPPRPPGGLVAPSLALDLMLAVSIPSNDQQVAESKMLPGAILGLSWRVSPFWELGLWYGLSKTSNMAVKAGGSVDYTYSTGGVRTRMHVVRSANFDGWFGLDLGEYKERWSFAGSPSGSGFMVGLPVGFDIPIARTWAIGALARYVGTSVELSGDSGNMLASTQSSRSFFELGLRLVFSIPFRDEPKGEPPKAAPPVTASTAAALF